MAYLCMRNGEECGFTASEFRTAQNEGWEKQYPYKVGKKKVYMTPPAAEAPGRQASKEHPIILTFVGCRHCILFTQVLHRIRVFIRIPAENKTLLAPRGRLIHVAKRR